MKDRLFSLPALLITILCLAAPAFPQGARGSITGQITDTTGAVIPGVEVTATQLTTNVVFKGVTTSTGVYHIEYLPAGNYRVSAGLQGFKTAVLEPVEVAVASVVTADLKLELGATNESVTVSATATRLESSSSELGYNVSDEDYHEWVIASNDDGQRQIQNFVFNMLPGTVGDSYMGSINGAPTTSHEVYIEGIPIGRADIAGSSDEFEPSVDAISEFRLQTGALSASYGGGLTAVANFNVKSGTNQLHGTGYEYFMNNDINANQFENNADGLGQGPFKSNNFGTAVGGPLLIPKIYNGKNKSFFFFSYEGTRVRQGLVSGFRTVPTAAFKQGNFSALPQAIYDPASTVALPDGSFSRTPFPGNIIPQSDFSSVSAKILELAPTPNPTLPGDFHNLLGINNQPVFNLNTYTGKFDQTITDHQKLSFYWSDNERLRFNGGGHGYLPVPGDGSGTFAQQNIYGTMVRFAYDWTITPTLLNHFAAGYNNFDNDHVSASFGQNWTSKIGLTGVEDQTFPVVQFTGTTAQGGSITEMGNNSVGDSPNGSYIVANDTTWIHGAHEVKFGVEVRKYFYIEPWNWGASGTFTFGPNTTADPNNLGTTGYAFASFLLGTVNSAQVPVEYVDKTKTDTWNPALYVTDNWKVTRKLTLNLGLRWDIVGGEYEIHGISSTFNPTTPNPGAGGYPGALTFLSNSGRSSWQNTYYGELGPRVGFAYQVNQRLVLRGGYGLMYTPPIANAFGEATIDGYYGNNNYVPTVMNAVFNWDSGFPPYRFPLPDKDPALDNGSSIAYIAPNSARQPYAQNYTFGIQYLLGNQTVIQASYVGDRGNRLNSANFSNMNQLNPKYLSLGDELLQNCATTGTMCAPGIPFPYAGFSSTNFNPTVGQALLPYPQYAGGGVINHFAFNGSSNYNALQVVATRKLSKGLGFLISYAFQKTLTDTDSNNIYYAGSSQDVYNRALEKSVASFDHTQQLRLTWLYQLPFGKGQPLLNRGGIVNQILGGWTITANQQYQSGDPLSIGTSVYTGDYLYDGNVRADFVSGQPLMSSQSGSLNFAANIGKPYLNPNAFTNPPTTPNGVILSVGNTPRNFGNLRGPWQPSENAGIFKRFPFREGMFFEFRCDMLNVFNRVVLADPDQTVGDPQFGQILGVANTARQIQLAARLTF